VPYRRVRSSRPDAGEARGQSLATPRWPRRRLGGQDLSRAPQCLADRVRGHRRAPLASKRLESPSATQPLFRLRQSGRAACVGGRHWADPMATSGQFSCPPLGSSYWPLTPVVAISASHISFASRTPEGRRRPRSPSQRRARAGRHRDLRNLARADRCAARAGLAAKQPGRPRVEPYGHVAPVGHVQPAPIGCIHPDASREAGHSDR
jgi:hypothetical protein